MTYYHLRYNFYPPPGFPVEKELWLRFAKSHDEPHLKKLLMARHNTDVSIILAAEICAEEYEMKTSQSPVQPNKIDIKNSNEWQINR